MHYKDTKSVFLLFDATRRRRLIPVLGAVVLALGLGVAQAQNSGVLIGDLSYSRANGSGGFGSHSLAANLEHSALPLSLGLEATQNLVDNVETSTQVGMTAGWRTSPVWSFAGHFSTMNDDLVNVNGRGLSAAWNLHKLWQGRRTTHLEVERNVYGYTLQSGLGNLNNLIPQQGRTRVDIRQGLSDALDIYVALEKYDYSQDPVDLARALLTRKARRVAVAGKLGDLLERSQTLGLSWSLADAWSLDVSASQSSTVLGQNQRQSVVALGYLFHPKSSLLLVYSDSKSDVLTNSVGLALANSQTDSTVELGVKWLF